MKEIWKPIPEFPNYECSNMGRIKNVKTNTILRGTTRMNGKGYSFIDLYNFDEHKRKNAQIHRIVATLFVENPENKPNVNHIDGNKSNNVYTNLEWCTQLENTRHAIEVLNHYGCGLNKREIRCIDTGVVYESMREAERQLGIPTSMISRCCTGQRKHARNLHFEYT